MNFRDAVVVITGASRGIGKATALALAKEGAHVVCTARSTDAVRSKVPGTIEETLRQIQALGGHALGIPCDISQDDQVEAMAQRTLAEFGRIDLLVNNAGTQFRMPFVEMPMKRWDVTLNVNLRGTVLACKAFVPQMIKQGKGCIINISSGAAARGGPELGILAYSVSKMALDRFSECLAAELRPYNISVVSLRVHQIASEGAMYYNKDFDYTNLEKPDAGADAIMWLATHEESYNGRIVSLRDAQADRLLGLRWSDHLDSRRPGEGQWQ